MEKAWDGNITLRIDEKEDTFSPEGSIEVEKYGKEPEAFALKIVGGNGRCSVVVRMGREDCKELIKRIIGVL